MVGRNGGTRRAVGGKVRRVKAFDARPRRTGLRLSIEERSHFMFGAVTLEVLIERLRPTIISLNDAGVVKPREISHWLNARGMRTARGGNWSSELVSVLLELLWDQSGKRLVWEQMTSDLGEVVGHGNAARPRLGRTSKPPAPRGLGSLSGFAHREEAGGPDRWPRSRRRRRRYRPLDEVHGTPSQPSPSAREREWKFIDTDFSGHSVTDLRNRWLNCIRRLNKPSAKYPKEEVKKLRDAIEREWRRRIGPGSRPDDYFRWPSTEATLGDGSLSDPEKWLKEGLLRFLRYSVGRNQERNESSRRAILSAVFDGELPPFHSAEYMREWGRPGTPARLEKLANSLAAFARNAKRRRDAHLIEAIADWESDLKFLYHTYYVGSFRFAWPSS